ncbi:DUF6048 family protein [Ekhidna sp.]
MWKYIFSIGLLVTSLFAFGQEQQAEKKKEPIDWRPYEIKIGVSAIRSARTFVGNDDFTTHELEAALALHRYNVVFDYGIEEHQRGETFDYLNKGSYFRAGIDRNFSKNKESGNSLTLGLRYARAYFSDEFSYTSDQGFGEENYQLENSDLTARWLELAFGVRGRIISNFYMGFTMRWQFSRKINGEGNLKTFDIPGFGKTRRQNSTAFDYYLMWRIPFKKNS